MSHFTFTRNLQNFTNFRNFTNVQNVKNIRNIQNFKTTLSTIRFASTLVIAQHSKGEVDASISSLMTCASKLGNKEIHVLVSGNKSSDKLSEISKVVSGYKEATKVLEVEVDVKGNFNAVVENVVNLVQNLGGKEKYSHVIAAGSNEGKTIIPAISAKMNGVCVSEILSVEGKDKFTRPIYAGNAIATVKIEGNEGPICCTVRPTNFDKAEAGKPDESKVEKAVLSKDDVSKIVSKAVEFISEEVKESDMPEISAAEIVISGGRALKSADNFKILYDLANKLGKERCAVGASRAAVDAGFAPNDLQIGQTGKVCAPNLYVAVGISGAIQHLAGMKDSKCIVAINTDEDAPIFQVADYGLKEDLFKAVPELTQKV